MQIVKAEEWTGEVQVVLDKAMAVRCRGMRCGMQQLIRTILMAWRRRGSVEMDRMDRDTWSCIGVVGDTDQGRTVGRPTRA